MNTSLVKKISLKNDDDVLSLNVIIQKNEEYKDNFRKNLLFELMRSGQLSSPEKKEKFLGYFQIWSIYFQRMMLLKTALCEDPAFTPLFYQHLDEEYGHDKVLFQEREIKSIHNDAILEAISNWFFSKMLSFTPYEQVVLVNLCLEASSLIFHEHAVPALDPNKKLIFLQLHKELDASHEKMGLSLLEDLTKNHYSRLLNIQESSWSMIEALMMRIAELAVKTG
jgi:hypothetical protein